MPQSSPMSRISDIVTLLARMVVGVVFIAHGLPKAADFGGTVAGFGALGIPLPEAAAVTAVVIEVGGGAALIAGFLLPLTGVALAGMMGGAYYFAHVGDPLVGGYEFLLVLAASALALGFSGGRYSLDRLLPWGRERKQESNPVLASA